MPASSWTMPPYARASPSTTGVPFSFTRLALNMESTNVVIANAASPSGPGSAGLNPSTGGSTRALVPAVGSRWIGAVVAISWLLRSQSERGSGIPRDPPSFPTSHTYPRPLGPTDVENDRWSESGHGGPTLSQGSPSTETAWVACEALGRGASGAAAAFAAPLAGRGGRRGLRRRRCGVARARRRGGRGPGAPGALGLH